MVRSAASFQERWPWLGPDLQTLRDTLRPQPLPADRGEPITIDLEPVSTGPGPGAASRPGVACRGGRLVALHDPPTSGPAKGLVMVLHGLGGSSAREGVRRQALSLQRAGFAVLRLNLRGAGPGRALAAGTYAASCNADLLPVVAKARALAGSLPLLGVGLSLGGTMLLNLLREQPQALDGKRLVDQTLADPFGVTSQERQALLLGGGPTTIRAFDAAITAPRWGYGSVDHYYAEASPLASLLNDQSPCRPPLLMVHAADDPWVPVDALHQLVSGLGPGVNGVNQRGLEVCIPAKGGHNGFHGVGDGPLGSWSDGQAVQWLSALVA
ncbi:MAG: alpha/beta fold hydrolase [Cyanobium sp. LacPavin_0920_WC12_MAG_62_9]|nr:alpha/beta fold hydrolase [Cyanobium sp. LacPavin_0920_WC12_MAG_62_9]